ncbi:TonB-dependent receptor [Tenacibaculum ovolyticum]|uniref:TonB-dependent receptor n=1 Tax=Tenacibaculum ovolyticum TaxID=104270 RepID=UPI001F1F12B0|nr:TonB-dependent receptor [Tenacibaculum ovolyticum]
MKKNKTPIIHFINHLSKKHNIYFTYNPTDLKEKFIDKTNFETLSLKKSLRLLKKSTSLKLDYLGNNYYVIYNKTKTEKKRITNTLDSVNNYTKITKRLITGVVLNTNYSPVKGASIIESETNNGAVTLSDGSFSLKLNKNNPIIIAHVGYESQTITSFNNQLKVILQSGLQLDEILVVGSRNSLRKKKDAAIATDIIDINKISLKSGLLEVNQFLQYSIPSFNATKQSGADGADHIVPATYRGLGPDQTLVLINGKRRHQASLINLYGTRGRGNSGTDLNTIPVSAIKRIEILKDGASAQYGSDAIAGVINIILKKNKNSLQVNTTLGFNNATVNNKPKRKSIDGLTYKVGINYGTKILENGFLNISTDFLSKDHTFRVGTSLREKFGDAAIKNMSTFFNSEIPITGKSVIYANGGYNLKNTDAYAFTRKPNGERNVTDIYPNGFNPLITSQISDKSFSIGLRSNYKNWNIDFNNTYGANNFHYFIKNTLNATLVNTSPTEFDAGGHSLSQNTTSVDLSRNFKKPLNGINVAFGAEHRLENYEIFAGEKASYNSYDIYGNTVTSSTPITDLVTLNNKIRPGGSQGFPGYSPNNELKRVRTNSSLYIDSEFDFTKKWMIATALRYENYSDFGSTLNSKLATRIKLTSNLNLRSSFSTGFRAPSLAQIYYNLAFTNYMGNQPTESLLVANNNPITRQFGIGKLKEEKAKNISAGLAYTPFTNFNFSIDSYYISIKDRIILSGNFNPSALGFNVENIQFFANGVNTTTRGIDLKINWFKKFNKSKFSISFFGNINSMKIDNVNNKNLDKETFFGIRERHFLLASAPKNKFSLNFNYQKEKFNLNANITRFSSVQLIDWQISKDLSFFNNSEANRITAATDTYESKYTVDLHLRYHFLKNMSYQTGVTNLFNTHPTVQDKFTDSGGLWDATQMGTSGAFYYTKIQISF